jgi:hypothetical protein
MRMTADEVEAVFGKPVWEEGMPNQPDHRADWGSQQA